MSGFSFGTGAGGGGFSFGSPATTTATTQPTATGGSVTVPKFNLDFYPSFNTTLFAIP